MNKSHANLEALSLSAERRVDQVCDAFEAAWKASRQPRNRLDHVGGVKQVKIGGGEQRPKAHRKRRRPDRDARERDDKSRRLGP